MIITRDILDRFPGTVVCASFCRRFRPHSWSHALFAGLYLEFIYSIGKMWEYQLQSTGISNFQVKRFLQDEKIAWPNDSLITKFTDIIGSLVLLKTNNETVMLSSIRDTLLPKLLSGEIRVNKLVGSVRSVDW